MHVYILLCHRVGISFRIRSLLARACAPKKNENREKNKQREQTNNNNNSLIENIKMQYVMFIRGFMNLHKIMGIKYSLWNTKDKHLPSADHFNFYCLEST